MMQPVVVSTGALHPPQSADLLQRLPAEIIVQIIQDIPDFQSLYHLIEASSWCYDIFSSTGSATLIHLIETSTFPRQVKATIYLTVFIRSTSNVALKYPTLDRFLTWSNSAEFLALPCIPSISPEVLQSISQSMYQIWCLTHACLQHYKRRSLAIKPSRLLDQKFRYTCGRFRTPWREHPETMGASRITPKDLGPPTWTEEHRVSRALWRVQMLMDLQRAVAENRLGWSTQEVEKLATLGAWEFCGVRGYSYWSNGVLRPERQQILTVLDFLDDLEREKKHRKDLMAAAASTWSILPFADEHFMEGELEQSKEVDAGPTKSDLETKPYTLPWPIMPVIVDWEPPSEPAIPPGFRSADQIPFLDRPVPGISMVIMSNSYYGSPLRFISFDPFRRLGFAIWDNPRVFKLKLLEPHPMGASPACRNGEIHFRWRSILSAEELQEHDQSADEMIESLKYLGIMLD